MRRICDIAIQHHGQLKSCATGTTKLMGSLWVIGLALCLGCAQPDITGKWTGPLPLQGGNDCQLKLYRDQRFEFACLGRDAPWGEGRWTRDGGRLRLGYTLYGVGERRLPEVPVPTTVEYVSRGNQMDVRWAGGSGAWVRSL